MFLLDDLLLAPVNGVIWLAEKIKEAADHEFSDPGVLKQKLMDLQMMLELKQISEDDFRQRESELLARLEEVTKEKEGSHA
jgi:hypothetical protein